MVGLQYILSDREKNTNRDSKTIPVLLSDGSMLGWYDGQSHIRLRNSRGLINSASVYNCETVSWDN